MVSQTGHKSPYQLQMREFEELQKRGAEYFAKTRTIFVAEDELNFLFHEKPRKAAERMRCLAIYLTICAECYERIAELKLLIEKGNGNAKTNGDSSSGQADSEAGRNMVPADIRSSESGQE